MNDGLAKRDEGGGAIQQTTEGFGSQSIARANETAVAAVAAQAQAMIQARYIVAMKNPRDMDTVRVKLLKECSRPGFAAVARYKKPMGKKNGDPVFIEGPSIRFAEAAIRYMGNIAVEPYVIWDDAEKRIVRVCVTDIENNVTWSRDVVLEKTVERKELKRGQKPLSTRVNSYGDLLYILPATAEEMQTKLGAEMSKASRTEGLRLVPGDVIEDCMTRVLETMAKADKEDPDAAKKRVLDAFAKIGVMPGQIAEYLGHDTSQIVTAELVDLRAVFSAISDGDTTWAALMASKSDGGDEEAPSEAQKAVEAVKAKLAAKQKSATDKAAAAVNAGPDPRQTTIDTKGE